MSLLTFVAEPLDEFDNVVFNDGSFKVEVTIAGETLFFDLEAPQYTHVLVVTKGYEADISATFYYFNQPIEGASVRIAVSKAAELVNTALLFIMVTSAIICATMAYIFYRKCIDTADTTSLKSEAAEVKENVFSIGMDFFDIASDIINYLSHAQYCQKFLTFYQVFLGSAGISAILVVLVNLWQLMQIIRKRDNLQDEQLTHDLRIRLMARKKSLSKEDRNRGEKELGRVVMARNTLRRKVAGESITHTQSKLSPDEKKIAMLQSLNDRFECMKERLVLKRRLVRSKVGISVVMFEDVPVTLLVRQSVERRLERSDSRHTAKHKYSHKYYHKY